MLAKRPGEMSLEGKGPWVKERPELHGQVLSHRRDLGSQYIE